MTGTAAPTAPRRASRALRSAPRRQHGLAGLFVVLFAVAGLMFSYGLEHAPPVDLCHPHDAVTWFGPGAEGAHHRLPHGDGESPILSVTSHDRTPPSPVETCLCLAVLLGIMLLVMAARAGRRLLLLPARAGWRSAAPARPSPASLSLASLQVLRL
ncbi:hypothetical protein [Actinomadura harenae]|uniref:Uncharacterized protein n=1 Tax=Actinomadura harenae TaxID=2483351 RepID=A0A3M2LZQ9_9ACTN|nr:hypothetical protein [Actinomadura harenae]RMI42696.1 hypothetical protein EBO15_18835 [Actinomadura harenae]